jgi:DNA-binding SARP family transcriptional activator
MADDTGVRVPVVPAKLRIPPSDCYGLLRLDAMMNRLWGRRLGLLIAPAGSGKTTLLSRFASVARVPVAWYRCESWDVSESHLLRHLDEAFAMALARPAHQWQSVEAAVADLDTLSAGGALLVIDDAHAISRTPAERALERLIDYAPPGLLVVIGSRSEPDFNLPRLRVSGAVVEITGEDLRLRSWEVESLFRDYYREPLPPVELAELARRTEGWAAGLQLFHLATTGKGLDERRRVLRAISGGSRLVRDYLTRNVLDELPSALREFLVDTCVLGRLSGPICDQFLNRTDSALLLQELERRHIFTTVVGTDPDYRYHEVLRTHLEHVLVADGGERSLRTRYGDAGAVLEQFGAIPEALHAFCRAENWTAVERVLGRNGAQLARRTGVWLDALPPMVLEHDPWLLLASARRHRAEGRWQNAVDAYQRAEKSFDRIDGSEVCRRERLNLAMWLTASPGPAIDGLGQLRQATIRDPLGIGAQLAGHRSGADCLVAGLSSLLAGETVEAIRLFRAAETTDEGDAVAVGARIAAAFGGILAGSKEAVSDLERAVEDADSRGQGFIARLGRACTALAGRPAEAESVRGACDHLGDQWGGALAALLHGWSLVDAGSDSSATTSLEAAAERFHELGAAVLEAWSRALLALALAQRRDQAATEFALRAESLANSAGVDGPKVFVYCALARADAWHTAQFVELARKVIERTGINSPRLAALLQQSGQPAEPPLTIRCFGDFDVRINGRSLQLAGVKPRTKALLRRLSADAGSAVHREVLQDTLWPDADADVAGRNLHVAISSLRQALEPGIARGASSLLVREGDSYRLVVPPGSDVDIRVFEQALEASRRARLDGDLDQAAEAFQRATNLASNVLFPEDGSAPWVVNRRQRVQDGVCDAGRALAEDLLSRGKPAAAVRVSLAVLNADRYDDATWRLLIAARGEAGDEAGARLAKADYRRTVSELSLPAAGS